MSDPWSNKPDFDKPATSEDKLTAALEAQRADAKMATYSQAGGQAASMLSMMIELDIEDSEGEYATESALKSGLQGAAAGAPLAGATMGLSVAAGFVIGSVGGYLTGRSAHRKARAEMRRRQREAARKARSAFEKQLESRRHSLTDARARIKTAANRNDPRAMAQLEKSLASVSTSAATNVTAKSQTQGAQQRLTALNQARYDDMEKRFKAQTDLLGTIESELDKEGYFSISGKNIDVSSAEFDRQYKQQEEKLRKLA